MDIEFASSHQQASFYSPLQDFEETTINVEIREDPLTDRHARIVPESFIMEEEPDIEAVVTDDENCFFCPDSVADVTPEYPDFVGMDRGSVGEATSFPNLNPYAGHSNVVVLTEDHYVPLDEFEVQTFADGFEAAMEYVQRVFEDDPDATVASVNMNFLRSAGSSIIHPHIQSLVDEHGTRPSGSITSDTARGSTPTSSEPNSMAIGTSVASATSSGTRRSPPNTTATSVGSSTPRRFPTRGVTPFTTWRMD
jgi:UDPglucose--hexose-1-phosphate uridylyltransferase